MPHRAEVARGCRNRALLRRFASGLILWNAAYLPREVTERIRPMKRYSAFAVAREALRYHTGWGRAWAAPAPANRMQMAKRLRMAPFTVMLLRGAAPF